MTHPLIRPSVFVGSSQWFSLHSYAAKYVPTPENRKAFKQYVNSITILFPCKECREHFKNFQEFNDIELYLDSPDRIFLWTYLAHDNATTAKGETSPPFNETKRFYFESLNGTCEKCD